MPPRVDRSYQGRALDGQVRRERRRPTRRASTTRPHETERVPRVQLREKQKAKRHYGVLEKQFAGYYEKASRQTESLARTCSRCSSAA